jgi:hypothetical protein
MAPVTSHQQPPRAAHEVVICPPDCFDAARYRASLAPCHALRLLRPLPASLTVDVSARFVCLPLSAFLDSDMCVCGRELTTFRDAMARSFDVAVVGVVGASLTVGAMVMAWGTTVAHAARVWQLRCRTSGLCCSVPDDDATASSGGGEAEDAALPVDGKGCDEEDGTAPPYAANSDDKVLTPALPQGSA